MGFEVFEKGSAPISTVPSVTIQKRGLFSLNDAAYRLIGTPKAVNFLWDAERRVIALRPAPADDLNAYPARRQNQVKGTGPVLIAGALFTRFIDLDTSDVRRWVPLEEDGMLLIDLNTDGVKVVSNRNRKAQPELIPGLHAESSESE